MELRGLEPLTPTLPVRFAVSVRVWLRSVQSVLTCADDAFGSVPYPPGRAVLGTLSSHCGGLVFRSESTYSGPCDDRRVDERLPAGLRAVVFDVGETLVDESRMWAERALDAGTTPFALMGVLGALIERDEDHRQVWQRLGVAAPASTPPITSVDLYPDAVGCLRAARAAGFVVGIAGNQPTGAVAGLRSLGFGADFVASSAGWRVAKPSPEFFERVVQAAGVEAGEVLYVGDRLDNDVLPANGAGLRTAFLRRGPWGHIHGSRPQASVADVRLDSLDELGEQLARYGRA